MNEIIKDYIHQISCKIVVNKLQEVLTYIIRRQMDLKNHVGISFNMLECVWEFDVGIGCKEVAYELYRIYDFVYNIGCPLQLVQLVQ
jgi:hypothetical protein